MRCKFGKQLPLMDANVELQDRFLERFFASPLAPNFYLTGGTALSRFYFHHRESVDLDLFTNQPYTDFDQVNRVVLGILSALALRIQSQVTTSTFLQYIVVDHSDTSLKVDIVKDVPVHFGAARQVNGVLVDSLENIGSNKVLAVFGRTDAKDFIDLYWILQRTSLEFDHLFELAKQKDLGLSELYLAYALHSIVKIKLFPRMLEPLPWAEIQMYFEALAKTLLTRVIPEG
jgi:predicted nucleotidyltransferase component of viral defense system